MKARVFNYIFIMALLAVVALTIGSSALLRMSVCMLLMLLLAFLSALLALVSADVKLKAGATAVERLSSVSFFATLRFTSPIPVSHINLILDSSSADGGVFMSLSGMPFRLNKVSSTRTFAHRGVYEVGEGRIEVIDMFGLFKLSRGIKNANSTVTVYPRSRPQSPVKFPLGDTGPEIASRFPDDASSPSGVRDWRDGDLLKRVHWKLTMKMYDPSLKNLRPMVRTYDEAARPDTIVWPDLSRVNAVSERALSIEDSICEAALSLIQMQLEDENPVRMILSGPEPLEIEGRGLADKGAFTDALTRAKFQSPVSCEQALADAVRRLDTTGAFILITSRLTPRIADAAIRLRRTGSMSVMLVWITDTGRAEAEELITRLEMADVIARRDNPFAVEAS